MRHSDGFTEGTVVRSILPHPARAVWGSVSSRHEGAAWELETVRRRRRQQGATEGDHASSGQGTAASGQRRGVGWIFEHEGTLPPPAYVLATAVASLEREWRGEHRAASASRSREKLRAKIPSAALHGVPKAVKEAAQIAAKRVNDAIPTEDQR